MNRVSERKLTEYLIENQVRLYRLAYSYLQNQEDALDAVQTTMCKAIEKQATLRAIEALPTWTRRILLNVCTDILHQRNRVILIGEETPDAGVYEDSFVSDSTLADQVNALPIEISTVIKLRFYEELSLKEISDITEVNLNTVKTRLYTGLKKLRVSMEGDCIL